MNKVNEYIFWVCGVVFVGILSFILFDTYHTKVTFLDSSIIEGSKITKNSAGGVNFFSIENEDVLVANRLTDKGVGQLFKVKDVLLLNKGEWAPNFTGAAMGIVPISTYTTIGRAPSRFVVYSDNREKYSTTDAPSDFIYLDNEKIIMFMEDQDDWTKPGRFVLLNIADKNKITEIAPYQTPGIQIISVANGGILFMDTEEGDVLEDRVIKKLDIKTKRITAVTTIKQAVSVQSTNNKSEWFVTKKNNETYSVYKYNLDNKTETLLSNNNIGIRFTQYGGEDWGFFSEGKLINEDETISKLTAGTDFLGRMDRLSKKYIFKSKLTGCSYPQIVSKNKAYFVCESKIYKISGRIF